jgi:serine/threonine-protein kinase
MEYVEGQSLSQRLKTTGTLAPELALRIAAEACSALSAAHQKGIVHRDIKPQNLLLAKGADGAESVKVIDFGIAKVREDAGLGFTGIVTGTTGYFVCTPAYASPEQAQGMRGSDLDGRSDVYSLGLVLYEMLTGSLPFAADNPQALLVQRLQAEPMPLNRARPGLTFSPGVSGLVMKALERDRGERYPSAGEMERAIAALNESGRSESLRVKRSVDLLAALPVKRLTGPVRGCSPMAWEALPRWQCLYSSLHATRRRSLFPRLSRKRPSSRLARTVLPHRRPRPRHPANCPRRR